MRFALAILFSWTALGATWPIGIPVPGWGINETKPTRPADWSSEVAGYYYVKDSDVGASDSRTYGTPTAPRNSIPNPIPDGSYIEVAGTYAVGSTCTIEGNGTAGSWVANTSGPVWITSDPNDRANFLEGIYVQNSEYVYIDLITCTDYGLEIGPTGDQHHIMVKDSIFHGDGVSDRSGCIARGIAAGNIDHENIIMIGNISRHWGDLSAMTDQDAIGLTIGRHCTYGWIISNIVHSTSGPAIRPGSSTTSDPTATATAHHLYVGGNTVSTNLQTAIWVKYGHHIIISGNDISNPLPHPVGGNPGMGMGAQYEPSHVAWIFNLVHDADFGFVSESYDVAVTNLVIGNEFYNIGLGAVSGYGGTGGEEAAFDFHGSTGSKMYIVGNTINHAVSGIHNRYDMDVYIENNIVSDLLSANSWHLMAIETANTFADHNVFYDSSGERIIWGASTYTLAQLVSNTSQGDNSINTDPQLVSDSNLTFPDTSPAKDAGQAAASLTVDVYAMFEEWFGESIAVDRFGTARPQNSLWDIGSFEYSAGAVPGVIASGVIFNGVSFQ